MLQRTSIRVVFFVGVLLLTSGFVTADEVVIEEGSELVQPENEIVIEPDQDYQVEFVETEHDYTQLESVTMTLDTEESDEAKVKLTEYDRFLGALDPEHVDYRAVATFEIDEDEFDDLEELEIVINMLDPSVGSNQRYAVEDLESGQVLKSSVIGDLMTYDVTEEGEIRIRYTAMETVYTGFVDESLSVMDLDGGSEVVRLFNEEPEDLEFELEASLEGVDADVYFEESGEESTGQFVMDAFDSDQYPIMIEPEETGEGELEVTMINHDWDTEETISKPVSVQETAEIQQREVSGIALTQILVVLVLSTVLLSFALL